MDNESGTRLPRLGADITAQIAEPGEARVEDANRHVRVIVESCGPIGVRIREVEVQTQSEPKHDVGHSAHRIAASIRPDGERLWAVEVDPHLGGAVLRTHPEDMADGRFFQLDMTVSGKRTLRRYSVDKNGDRTPQAFDLTRRQLEALVDGLARGGSREDD